MDTRDQMEVYYKAKMQKADGGHLVDCDIRIEGEGDAQAFVLTFTDGRIARVKVSALRHAVSTQSKE